MANKAVAHETLAKSIEDIIRGKEVSKTFIECYSNEYIFFDMLSSLFMEKECKWIKCYKNLVRYYAQMIVQYIEICETHNIDQWHDYPCFEDQEAKSEGKIKTIFDLIKASIPFYKSRYNRQLACVIDKLVKNWDDALKKRHKVIPNHCVFMLYSDTDQGKTLMFHYEEEPDKRLIVIFVTQNGSLRKRLLICLHELGHYIGCRKRSERCELYVLLCTLSLLEMTYRRAWATFLGVGEEYIIPNSTGNTTYSTQLRNELLNSRTSLGSCTEEVFKLLKNAIMPLDSPKKAYLRSMHELVTDKLNGNLDKIEKIFSDQFADKGISVIGHVEFSKAARENIGLQIEKDRKKSTTDCENDKEYNELAPIVEKCSLIDRVDTLFSEIAADIFMVRVGGIVERNEYYQLILNETVKQWKIEMRNSNLSSHESKERFINFALSDLFRIRIMAILHAIPSGNVLLTPRRYSSWLRAVADRYSYLDELYKDANNALDGKDYIQELSSFSYKCYTEQDIWNPQRALSLYAKQIYADELYEDTCNDNATKKDKDADSTSRVKDSIEELRTFLTYNTFTWYFKRLLWRLR